MSSVESSAPKIVESTLAKPTSKRKRENKLSTGIQMTESTFTMGNHHLQRDSAFIKIMLQISEDPRNIMEERDDFTFSAWADIMRKITEKTIYRIKNVKLMKLLVKYKKMYSMIKILEARGIIVDKQKLMFNCNNQTWNELCMEYGCKNEIKDLQCCAYFYDDLVELGSRFQQVELKRQGQTSLDSSSGTRTRTSNSGASSSNLSVSSRLAHLLVMQQERMEERITYIEKTNEVFKEFKEEIRRQINELKMLFTAKSPP